MNEKTNVHDRLKKSGMEPCMNSARSKKFLPEDLRPERSEVY